jgi:hypothetical protein
MTPAESSQMVEFAPHQYINRKVGEALGIIKKEVRETDAAPSIRSLENSDAAVSPKIKARWRAFLWR